MSAVLTVARLAECDACDEHIARFVALFGEEVEVTEALCVRHAEEVDWDFAALVLLRSLAGFIPHARAAGVAFDEATATIEEDDDEGLAPARRAYAEALASAWARAFIAQEARS